MSKTALRVAQGLSLPVDVAGEAVAILATRGAGKSFTSAVVVEELHAAKVQFCVLDPTGVYWGLRAAAEGGPGGLPVILLGGPHGDAPLEPTAGRLIADVLVDTGQSLILDLSDFTKGEQTRFVSELADRLFNRKARSRSTLHVVMDEADEFAPQKPMGRDEPIMLGRIIRLVAKGRSRGIGVTLITQRSATLNKNVLDLADTVIAMRVLSPRDRKAIQGWVDYKNIEDEKGVIVSLPSLPTGTAWVWSPVRGILTKVKIRRIRTFDSYATPKPGQRVNEPTELAPVDVAKLGKEIAATKERAVANDPVQLRKRNRELEQTIADLQRQVASVETSQPEPERIEVQVEVPVLDEDAVLKLKEATVHFEGAATTIDQIAAEAQNIGALVMDVLEAARKGLTERTMQPSTPRRESPRRGVGSASERPHGGHTMARSRHETVRPADTGDVKLGKGERTVLDVLAEYPEGRTYNELAFLAGYSAKASTLGVILSNLRKAALVEPGNQPVRATAEGLEAAGGVRERPTGDALLQQWLNHPRIGTGERTVLLALIDLYPTEPTHEELCEMTGYSPIASTMGVILSKLRKLGLVEKGRRRAAPEFMEAIERG